MDLALLAHLADARPAWQLVMVGPVVGIERDDLPQRHNIHWLGMQPYARLPHLMQQWSLCLMPFARNEATRFINPAKALEYMAGEKPVVSTPVHDVVALYGDVVHIGRDAAGFVAACDAALAECGDKRSRRIGEMLSLVGRTSWDHAADTVHRLLEAELARRPARPAAAREPARIEAPGVRRAVAIAQPGALAVPWPLAPEGPARLGAVAGEAGERA
jgi:glycosyltransferase involved in cell wall biosynthesis